MKICEANCVNEKAIQEIKEKMPEDRIVLKIANISRILGDPVRIKILLALSQRELCVCDLASLLNMTQSAVSHQLRLLRNTNFVKYRKEGKSVYYSLADKHVMKLIEMEVEHAKE